MTTKRTLIFRIKNKELEFLRHIMKRGSLENLTHTRHTEGKRDEGRQQATYLMSLCEWMARAKRNAAKGHRE